MLVQAGAPLITPVSSYVKYHLLLWPSLVGVGFAANFLSTLPLLSLQENPVSGSTAVAPSALQSFQAMSPAGQKSFTAKYVLFSPSGPQPAAAYKSGAAVLYDMNNFGWCGQENYGS